MKLASGICPVETLLEKGVNVALGTDSAASNNTLDMFAEMKLAAMLAKVNSRNCTSVPAPTALEMATINGAKALGMEQEIGSIEVGKSADLIAITFDSIEMLPMYNPIGHIAYVAGREHVTDVWIQGRRMLQDRVLATIDEAQLKSKKRNKCLDRKKTGVFGQHNIKMLEICVQPLSGLRVVKSNAYDLIFFILKSMCHSHVAD
ncbi:hypothetical protein ABG067_003962 [Albugo candida]